MHYAVEQGTPPKRVDGRLVTVRDDELRPLLGGRAARAARAGHRSQLPHLRRRRLDLRLQRRALRPGHRLSTRSSTQLGVDEPTHAFYLGKELMKATIARGLRKNYRQESPLDWGYMTFAEPKRERVKLTASAARRRGVKKILIQLDTDEHPSTFDAIVAHDADVDVAALATASVDAEESPRGSCSPPCSRAGRRTSRTRRSGSAARACATARRSSTRSRRPSSARSRSSVDARLQRLQHDRRDRAWRCWRSGST